MTKLDAWLEAMNESNKDDAGRISFKQAIAVIEKLKEALEILTYASAFAPEDIGDKLSNHCNKALAIDPEKL